MNNNNIFQSEFEMPTQYEEEVRKSRARRMLPRKYRPSSSRLLKPLRRPNLRRPWLSRSINYGDGGYTQPEPQPEGSEYIRWVQTAINQTLNLQLPVDGVLNVQTRSAVRSFQKKNGLPATGIVGPDTEKALMEAMKGQDSPSGASNSSEPGSPQDSSSASTVREPSRASSLKPSVSINSTEFEFDNYENPVGNFVDRIGTAVSWLTGINLTPIEDRTAITARKFGYLRKGNRDLKKVYALVLHHTAGPLKERPEDLDHTNAHFVITPKGRILKLHPMETLLWASNGFNAGSVAVEFVGNFRNEKGICWYKGPHFLPCTNKPTPEQIKAGRDLVLHLRNKINLTHILTHRQSSSQRDGCPGPDIWYYVGQWAVNNFGLKDGGSGFYIRYSNPVNNGKPIPDSWRNWGRGSNQPELMVWQSSQANPSQLQGEFDFGAGSSEWQSEINRKNREYIKWVQQSLNQIMGLTLAVDGVLGAQTRSAIRSFQRKSGLLVDSIVGPQTERALISAGAGNPPVSSLSSYTPSSIPTLPYTTPSTPAPPRPVPSSVAERILNIARRWVGFNEGVNNTNPFSAYFNVPNVAWCAYFVSYVYTKAGFPLNIGSSDVMLKHIQTKGRFFSNTTVPKPADIVVFDWTLGDHDPAEHVGLVEKVYNNSSGQTHVGTIEGNTSDGVRRRRYALGDPRIVGFGRLVGV